MCINKNNKGFTLIELFAVLQIIFGLVLTIGVVWVAIHFIAKYW